MPILGIPDSQVSNAAAWYNEGTVRCKGTGDYWGIMTGFVGPSGEYRKIYIIMIGVVVSSWQVL